MLGVRLGWFRGGANVRIAYVWAGYAVGRTYAMHTFGLASRWGKRMLGIRLGWLRGGANVC